MTPASDTFPYPAVDLTATRRQFLFAREQLAAHQPHAQRAGGWPRSLAPRPFHGARHAEG
jgi:hypothetical protein